MRRGLLIVGVLLLLSVIPLYAAAPPTVGLSLSTLNNPFFVDLRDGAQAAAKKMNVNLVVVDAQNDSAREASQIEDLIQKKVGKGNEEVVGVISLLYDHRTHHLSDVLADMQHKASVGVNASLHIHLDVHNCLEVIVVRGAADKVHEVAGKLIATKGVQNGRLITTTTEIKR